jgi:pimeloyl-ACP methyl ester carboxylesterase
MSRPYVLVHGASRGAWLWDRVVPLLEKAGAKAYALDLPGHGARGGDRKGITTQTYADDVAKVIKEKDLRDVVLVGHSMGGIIISKTTELVPDRIGHLVYLAAAVLPDGGALIDTLPPDRADLYRKAAAASPDNTVFAPLETLKQLHFTDMTDAEKDEWARKMCPQPLAIFTDKVDLKTFYGLKIPKTYILATQDKALVPDVCRTFAARIGCVPIEIEGSHDLMVSRPAEVARVLLSIPNS